jgi:hypothetical protein
MLDPIDPRDAATLAPFSFAPYARHAAERGAHAITLTAADLAEVAAMVREAQSILDNAALDVSDLNIPSADPLTRLTRSLEALKERL